MIVNVDAAADMIQRLRPNDRANELQILIGSTTDSWVELADRARLMSVLRQRGLWPLSYRELRDEDVAP